MRFIVTLLILLAFQFTSAQSLRINEFSQGASGSGSGSQEWVELIVVPGAVGPTGPNNCGVYTINISGWILDDNNGTFSPSSHYNGSGIAQGHIRFKNVAPWNNLPVGALILIYNGDDFDNTSMPVTDLTDANMDCAYIVPSNSSVLEYCPSFPVASGCSTATTTYSGACTYTTPVLWSSIGMANAGDVIQIRDASFNLVHAVAYGQGTGACGVADIVGNYLSPYIGNSSMSNQFAYYNGTDIAGYIDAAQWVRGTYGTNVPTPGAYNNSTNQSLIETIIRGGCTCERILDLYLKNFFATKTGKQVNLSWEFENSQLVRSFELERSADGLRFSTLTQFANVAAVSGNWPDINPAARNYYRLKLYLNDGSVHYSRMVPVFFGDIRNNLITITPNPFRDHLVVQKNDANAYQITLLISDISGRRLFQKDIRLNAREQYINVDIPSTLPKGILLANVFYQSGNADVNQSLIRLLHQ